MTEREVTSRYKAEFKEISILGKGEFGVVYDCVSLADGRHYAIKKIPVTAKKFE